MLERNGHSTDKIEYITKGGTWNAYPLKYQYWYILESFKACNNLSRRKKIPSTEESYWNDKPLDELQKALDLEIKYNENCHHRIIGLTLETRPDAISAKTIYHMRRQGCTRIELGLQAPDDDILTLIKRGHTVDQFRKAIYLLRKAGFKVDLHFMPDLPGTTPEHDVEMYKSLFSDPALRPDMVKIYPNAVIPSAELYQWYLDGRFKPYGEEALFDALLQMKLATPRYCRISRLIRDIPANEIKAGNIITNLREMLETELKKRGERCVCLRCREISRQKNNITANVEPILFVDEYNTLGGHEYFITFEDKDRTAVFGFLRLRIPTISKSLLLGDEKNIQKQFDELLPEIKNCAFVRELHVYGTLVGIGKRNVEASQHKGLGKKLMATAESISKKQGSRKISVISGVGVRGYYRKLGYRLRGTYMVKSI
jgi:ELP3 family radical SAM enzyme/protein acetyltransferase